MSRAAPLAVLALLVSAEVAAQGRVYDRACDFASRRSDRGGVACTTATYALFEFAPTNGSGMGSACACTTPTGAKGEALTFSRASTAWCTKGNETTGIVDGDLVECASGQPRVMPGGDGTGELGLAVWSPRTNSLLRSQEIDNAAWLSVASAVGNPTVTANHANGPCGAPSASCGAAERLQVPAASGADYSIRYQTACPSGVVASAAVYLKGTSGSGTTTIAIYRDTAVYVCVAAAYNATTWTRIENANVLTNVATPHFAIGALAGLGCTNSAAADVLVWQADCQAGAVLGPPITTAGTTATRVVEVADLALTFGAGTTGYSAAATSVVSALNVAGNAEPAGVPGSGTPGVDTGSATYLAMYFSAGPLLTVDQSPGGTAIGGTPFATTLVPLTGSHRYVHYFTGTTTGGCLDGTCQTRTAGVWTAPTFTRFRLNGYTSAGSLNGVIKKVCLDPSSDRCR